MPDKGKVSEVYQDDELLFLDEAPTEAEKIYRKPWKIMIVDDEEEVHNVTHLVLGDYSFEGAGIEFLSAYTGQGAKEMISKNPDTAAILLDVVMETDQAGLELVRYIREELNNSLVRIILRTGQPGQAPERKVIIEYDINDYKAKSELTSQKLFTAITAALRSYRDLNTIEEKRQNLRKIIDSLNVAREVQQNLLPQAPPHIKGIGLAGCSIYCDETGGDYYDFIDLTKNGRGSTGVVLGDVSGHGISSALLMSSVRAYLRGRAAMPGTPADIINHVNRLVSADTLETGQFMTLFYLEVEPATGNLTWIRAGHDPAYLYSPDEDLFHEIGGKGLALGLDEDWIYKEYKVDTRQGQILILASDGIWETQNEQGEMFGKNRLKDIVRNNINLGAEEIHKAVMKAVDDFRGQAPQEDDVTLVVMKFK